MKLIIFTQAKIDGEDSPKVLTLGKCAIDKDAIVGFYEIFDKYDIKINGVLHILLADGKAFLVQEKFDDLLTKLKTDYE